MGARPLMSASLESITTSRRPDPLEDTHGGQEGDVGCHRDEHGRGHVQARRHDQRDPAPQPVAQGPDHELPESEPQGGGREGHLDLGIGDPQVGLEGWKGGQVQVYGERTESGQQTEGDDGSNPPARAEPVPEWLWHSNSADAGASRANK